MRKTVVALVNVLISVIVTVVAAWLLAYTVCLPSMWGSSRFCHLSDRYAIAGGTASILVMLNIAYAQYGKSKQFFEKKKRPVPEKYRFNKTFDFVLNFTEKFTASDDVSSDTIDFSLDMERGWRIPFEDDIVYEISRRDLYYFLIRVCEIQDAIDVAGRTSTVSPLGLRQHNIGRRRMLAYRFILSRASVLVKLNSNVSRVSFTSDPWLLVDYIEAKYPSEKL